MTAGFDFMTDSFAQPETEQLRLVNILISSGWWSTVGCDESRWPERGKNGICICWSSPWPYHQDVWFASSGLCVLSWLRLVQARCRMCLTVNILNNHFGSRLFWILMECLRNLFSFVALFVGKRPSTKKAPLRITGLRFIDSWWFLSHHLRAESTF